MPQKCATWQFLDAIPCPEHHPRSSCSHSRIATSAPPSPSLDPLLESREPILNLLPSTFCFSWPEAASRLCCLGEYAHNTPLAMHHWSYNLSFSVVFVTGSVWVPMYQAWSWYLFHNMLSPITHSHQQLHSHGPVSVPVPGFDQIFV